MTLKAAYAQNLRAESTRSFRDFCSLQTKENVWSLTNRLLKESTARRPPTTLKINNKFTADNYETATALLNHFYPPDLPDTDPRHHELTAHLDDTLDTNDEPPFTSEEVLEHLSLMNPNKAPGLDNLTSDICLQFTKNYPRLITDIMNRCLALQHFPDCWKVAYVKIIPKPSKSDYGELNSFRPIGLLPVFGKLLERLFIKRVTFWAAGNNHSCPRQFGFREQTNTTAAINSALGVIRRAKESGELVIALSLDIKAAFDNAWWPALFHRLRLMNCPHNIYGLICSYVRNRMVTLDHAGVRVTKMMTKGCIQGSACGPVLWNIILDELLEEELPAGCHIQAFADDVFLVVSAKDVHRLESATNTALSRITAWGSSVKLVFGPSKTQMIAFTPGAKTAKITMNGHTLKFSSDVKLLGVMLDEKLLFNKHIQYVIGKATKIFNKLCLFTRPTWGAHPENIRAIYHQVIVPIVTYAAGVWGHVASKRGVRKRLEKMQRGFAIKAIKAFRTVSTSAALALAEFTPIDLKIQEVHAVERTRLSCKSDFLPHDITYEKPTQLHELLHPSERITIQHDTLHSQREVDAAISPDSVCIYTDGSKQEDGAVGAAFVAYVPAGDSPNTVVKKFKLHDSCSVFQAELLAIFKACNWTLNNNHIQTVLFSDSLSAIKAIQNRSNTHPIVVEIHKIIYEIRKSGCIKIVWVKSHAGIVGNEMADMAANAGCKLHKTPDYAHFAISYTKHLIRTKHRALWQTRYESAEQGRHTKTLLPTLDDITTLNKITCPDFYLTQVLTGHGFHKSYLYRFKITPDDRCPCDDITPQTLEHLLETCPAFGAQRATHEILCANVRVSPYKIVDIMKKESSWNSYVTFVKYILSRLKRFNVNN